MSTLEDIIKRTNNSKLADAQNANAQQPQMVFTQPQQTTPVTPTATPQGTTTPAPTAPATTPAAPQATTTPAPVTAPAPTAEPQQEKKKATYMDMLQSLTAYKPLTPEEAEAQRKREKRDKMFASIGDGISALANLFATNKYSPNAYDPKNSMSAKAQERWDKIKKERREDERFYLPMYMQAMRNDEEAARDDRNWKHQLERDKVSDDWRDKEFKYKMGRDQKADEQWEKKFKTENEHWQQKFNQDQEHWQKSFDESKRQFDVKTSIDRQQLALSAKRLAHELSQNKGVTFALGQGKGTITIPNNALNASNIAYVFSKLPAKIKSGVHGEAVYSKTGKVIGHKEPTTEAMLMAIGTNVEGNLDVQNALRDVANQKNKGGR